MSTAWWRAPRWWIVRCLGGLDYWRYGLKHDRRCGARSTASCSRRCRAIDQARTRGWPSMSTMPAARAGRCSTASSGEGGVEKSWPTPCATRARCWDAMSRGGCRLLIGPITVLGERAEDLRPTAPSSSSIAPICMAADDEPVTALMAALDRRSSLALLAIAVSSPQAIRAIDARNSHSSIESIGCPP